MQNAKTKTDKNESKCPTSKTQKRQDFFALPIFKTKMAREKKTWKKAYEQTGLKTVKVEQPKFCFSKTSFVQHIRHPIEEAYLFPIKFKLRHLEKPSFGFLNILGELM